MNPTLVASLERRWITDERDRHYRGTSNGRESPLSDEERAFLVKHESLSLASTPSWPPFEMEQGDGS